MLLIGIRAFESFEVPALVGLAGNVTVLTTNIYQSSKNTGSRPTSANPAPMRCACC